ncbi:hypothetical protein [Umezawaea tangerina]|uniref:Uncharacterized protein n=1 Tax=Umezawaea tangerina TaxID=84725 RepID=A0A2T0TJT0_9PSEU|nr:hypothetical protein [Umezawaea tangerina]PRY45768.1 hypothetical protein CLV43_10128 [Umezawaea tangerina]
MSAFMQAIRGFLGRLTARHGADAAARLAEFEAGGEPVFSAAMLTGGAWSEGKLKAGRYRLVWWVPGKPGVLDFSRRDGVVESLGGVDGGNGWTIDPNMVVLHYRRGADVVQLAVPPTELELVSRILPLPQRR